MKLSLAITYLLSLFLLFAQVSWARVKLVALPEREATVTLKASGTEAHMPTLHNVEQRRPSVMTSSDVRMG